MSFEGKGKILKCEIWSFGESFLCKELKGNCGCLHKPLVLEGILRISSGSRALMGKGTGWQNAYC